MEREILFRGKDEVTKEWRYGYLLSENVIGEVVNTGSDYSFTLAVVIPETVGKFSGFKDRSNNQIFKGDRIKIDYGEKADWTCTRQGNEHVVDEICGCFVYDSYIATGDFHLYYLHEFLNGFGNLNVTVIGNIHE